MRYEDPPLLSHAEAVPVLERALRAPVAENLAFHVLVGLALHDDDRAFVERWCVALGQRAPDLAYRGLAALCIGHLARRFREVSRVAAELVRALAQDEAVVRANSSVLDGLDDLEQFMS
jgi:hypothetical protein